MSTLVAWWPITETAHTTQHLIAAAEDDLPHITRSKGVLIDGEPVFTRAAGSSVPGASAYAEVIHCTVQVQAEGRRATNDQRGRDAVEDVEWLLSWGTHPHEISRRVGSKPDSLARLLARHGRHDLAAQIHAGGATCQECGGWCSLRARGRCQECAKTDQRSRSRWSPQAVAA